MSAAPRWESRRRRPVVRSPRAAFEPLEQRRLLAAAPLPSVSIADAAVTEGDAGTKRLTFSVTLSAPAATPTKVRFTTIDGTATAAGRDYVAAAGWVTFPAGRTRATVTVTVRGDTASEADEAFGVALARPVGCTLGRSAATGTIRDDDTPTPPQTGSWTVLVYMTGDNLNPDARDDINEMERALATLPAGVRFVVSWDQPPAGTARAHATGGGRQAPWRTYGRSVLQADVTRTIASTFDLSFGERNTGDPATLVDFVRWGVARAPAARYVLQLWGHGGGLAGSQFDGESGYDPLSIAEIAGVLGAPGVPTFDVVSYDNCLMAMAEVGAALAPRVGGVFVASQELVNASGQDYADAYAALAVADPAGVTPAQVAAGMVGSFAVTYAGDPLDRDTFSATLAAGYANLTAALRTFADTAATLAAGDWAALRAAAEESIAYDTPSFRDLGSFMAGVAAAAGLPAGLRTAATGVTAALTAALASKTSDQRGSSGLSIYLPTTADDRFLAAYATDAAAFCAATGWDGFVRSLVDGAATNTVLAAPGPAPRARGPVATFAAAAWAALAGGEPAAPGGRRGGGIRRVG